MMVVAVLREAGVGGLTPSLKKSVRKKKGTVGEGKDKREELEGKPC